MFTGIFRRLPRAAAALAASVAAVRPASAAEFPDHPIRWLVPFSAGGAATSPRASWPGTWPTRWASRWWSRTVPARPPLSPPRKPRARADGYTLMTAGMSTLALNPWLYRKLPYDPQKNLAPVSTLVDLPIVLVVSPDSNLHTLADVIAYLKSDKAPSYASLGVGSPHHLAMELFLETVKGKATAIPWARRRPCRTWPRAWCP